MHPLLPETESTFMLQQMTYIDYITLKLFRVA